MLQLLGDLFEAQSGDMPQVQHLLIGLGEIPHGCPQGLGHVRIDFLVRGSILAAGLGHWAKHLACYGDGLPLPATHFVPKPIHGDSEEPRLKLALLHIRLEFGRHGAESGLGDFLGEVVIVAIAHQQGMHARRVLGHNRLPCGIITIDGLPDHRLGVFRVQRESSHLIALKAPVRHPVAHQLYNRFLA